jgi:glutathione-regulated potassium-efflux system ancillary protein KefC
MSTGLTFGSISALFGLTHGVITQAQYSYLIAAVIGGAVIPTMIANAFFLSHHLLPKSTASVTPTETGELSPPSMSEPSWT